MAPAQSRPSRHSRGRRTSRSLVPFVAVLAAGSLAACDKASSSGANPTQNAERQGRRAHHRPPTRSPAARTRRGRLVSPTTSSRSSPRRRRPRASRHREVPAVRRRRRAVQGQDRARPEVASPAPTSSPSTASGSASSPRPATSSRSPTWSAPSVDVLGRLGADPQGRPGQRVLPGQAYGVPGGTDGRVLYFNKKLFQQAGLPADWQPTSWQDILDAGAKLKSSAGSPRSRSTPARRWARPPPCRARCRCWSAPAPRSTRTASGRATPRTSGTSSASTSDLLRQGPVDPNFQQDAKGRDESFAAFAANKIGILLEGDYFWRWVVNPDKGVAPMADPRQRRRLRPDPGQRPGSGISGQDVSPCPAAAATCSTPTRKYPQQAWELLAFMNSPEAIKATLGGIGPDHRPRRTSTTRSSRKDPLLGFIASKVLPLTRLPAGPGRSTRRCRAALQQATADVVAGTSVARRRRGLPETRGGRRRRQGRRRELDRRSSATRVTAVRGRVRRRRARDAPGRSPSSPPRFLLIAAFLVFPALWTLYLGITDYRLTGVAGGRTRSSSVSTTTPTRCRPGLPELAVAHARVRLRLGHHRPDACSGFPIAWLMRRSPRPRQGRRRDASCSSPGSCRARSSPSCGSRSSTATAARSTRCSAPRRPPGCSSTRWLSIVVFNTWRGTAFSMMLFSAALGSGAAVAAGDRRAWPAPSTLAAVPRRGLPAHPRARPDQHAADQPVDVQRLRARTC